MIFFQILGSLALLIYGMKVMSEALQKMQFSRVVTISGRVMPEFAKKSFHQLWKEGKVK